MILQKCPRCQRDQKVENSTTCEHCGYNVHEVENRPKERRIRNVENHRATRVAHARGQAHRGQAHRLAQKKGKVDTPNPDRRREQPRSRRPTLRIKGYDIIECRGKGGMGKVYRAVQKSLGRDVAIKTLDENLARNQASIWRFTKEAAAMAQLRHPNILYVIDRGKERNTHYFVMEYVDGPSLREMLRDRGKFSASEALHIMLQLSRTMSYAHFQGVVHRDLKPENILYNSDKCLKVADFGLAGVNRETTYIKQLTKSYVSMGTECYMAPEQRHDAKKVDQRADIYSMGVILFELIRGELPFPSLPPPEQAIVEGRRDIDAIIRCCLHYDKEHRYQTTEDLVQALEKALEEGEKAPVPSIRDTVIDTPAASPLGMRIENWNPEDFSSSPDALDDANDSLSWQPHSRNWIRGGLFVAVIATIAALFFMFAPSPKSNQKIRPSEMWQRLVPDKQKVSSRQARYHFRFAGTPGKNYLGRIPQPQWKLFGNWFAHEGKLHQNTFQRGFVRNRKQLWAVFRGKELSGKGFRHRAQVQILQPWFSGGISKREYRSRQRASRKIFAGLGWKGGAYGQTALLLQLEGRMLGFRLKVGKRTGERVKCGSDELLPREWRRQRYTWGKSVELELRQRGNMISAWVNGRKRCQLDVPRSSVYKVRPSLICQNAHCTFQQVQIDAFSQRASD